MVNSMDKKIFAPGKAPKVVYSTLYECFVCIYIDSSTGKWITSKCETQSEADEFVEKLRQKQNPLPWYLNS